MPTLAPRYPRAARKARRSRRITYEDFLQADLGHHHFEWVDGEVIEMSAVEIAHVRLSRFLSALLELWLEDNGGGEILQDPFQMRLPSRPSGRAPDIQVVLPRSLPRIHKLFLDGPADVVIEIISTGSRTTDRRDKFSEYEEGGVPEYWLIDPILRQAEFYILKKGSFIPAEIDAKGHFHSRQLRGVWIDTDWLWSLPSKASILKKWKSRAR